MKDIFLIGYSGHAYVVCDIFKSMGLKVTGYFDKTEKQENPYNLKYLGSERDGLSNQILQTSDYFIDIGNYHIIACCTNQNVINMMCVLLALPAI
ncbi:MAG: hypothetical protein MRK02_15930 [Candidatus Scalindua sp.]|nr:hypothetical protein [Candidatus Scalindua sp.]